MIAFLDENKITHQMNSCKKPWLSVLIPSYNGDKYIKTTLDSIVLCEAHDIEIIIIDDGSQDKTLSIIQSYQARLNIKLKTPPRTGNWAKNTNYALSLATADHVCFLHQDDYWLEGRLARVKLMIARYPDCVLYLHDTKFVDPSNRSLGKWSCPLPSHPQVISSNYLISRLIIQDFIAICSPVFKRQQAIAVGGLDEALWYTADWDFWLKLASRGSSSYLPETLTAFRVHEESQTIKRSISSNDFNAQLNKALSRHLALNKWLPYKTAQAAKFSVNINTLLATIYHGRRGNILKVAMQFFLLGPSGWMVYFRDSRILQRVSSRLKAKLRTFYEK